LLLANKETFTPYKVKQIPQLSIHNGVISPIK